MTEHENDELILTPDQLEAWRALSSGWWRRGAQAKLAERLAKKGNGKPTTWKATLSRFKRGDRQALASVFRRAGVLKLVAESVGLEASELRAKFDAIRAPTKVDAPSTWRLAGFPDYPAQPILEVFHPPWVTRTSSTLEGGPSGTIGGGGLLDVPKVADQCAVPGRVIVVAGEPGVGRTGVLRAVAATLSAGGVATAWDRVGEPKVVLADDFDAKPAHEREALLAGVRRGVMALIAAVDRRAPVDFGDLPRAVYTLERGPRAWIEGLLKRIEDHAPAVIGRAVDLGALRGWLDQDPLAESLCHRADVAGALARLVAEGGTPRSAVVGLLDVFLEHAVARLRGLRRGGEANFLSTHGRSLMRRLSEAASLSLDDAIAAVADIGGAPSVSALDASSIVDALERCGLLVRAQDRLSWSPPVLRPIAMGADLHGRALERALLEPDLELALVAAAEHAKDLAPLLGEAEAMTADVQCAGMPALTRLLATDVPCTDPALFRRSYLRALAWWLRWPVEPMTLSVTLSAAPQAEAAPAREDRVSGVSPFRMLALASVRHADCLPLRIAVADVRRRGVMPPALDAYLTLMGATFREDVETQMLLGIAAPAQALDPDQPDLWRAFHASRRGRSNGGPLARISADELMAWWAHVAGRYVSSLPDGRQLLSGTGPVGIEMFIVGAGRAEVWWPQALESALRDGLPRAAAALAAAIREGLRLGGIPLSDVVRHVWSKASSAARADVRGALFSALRESGAFVDGGNGSLQRWVAEVALGAAEREALWAAWLAQQSGVAPRQRQMPWQAFCVGEEDEVRIAQWAVASEPAVEHGRPAAEALIHLLDAGRLGSLCEIVVAASIDPQWRGAAAEAIVERHRDDRATRLALAARTTDMTARAKLLRALRAEPGEADAWAAVAEAETHPTERLRYLAAWAYALDEHRGWIVLTDAIADVASSSDLEFGLDFALQDVGFYACRACLRGPEAIRGFVERVLSDDALRPRFKGEMVGLTHVSFWIAADKVIGWPRTCEALSRDTPELTLSRLIGFARLDEYTDRLAERAAAGALVEPAAAALARCRPKRALQLLDDHPIMVRGELTPTAMGLLGVLLRTQPAAALDILERRLRAARGVGSAWKWIVPRTPAGEPRRRAHAAQIASARRR